MDCISPGTGLFFAWKEHFSSVWVCLSLLMEGNSTRWALNLVKLHGSFLGDPPAAILQHLRAWAGLLLCPIPAWHGSHDLGRWAKRVAADPWLRGGPCQPKRLCKRSRRSLELIWAKRLEKQLQVVSEGNATIL